MATGSLQPGGTAPLLTRSVSSSVNAHQRTSTPQQLFTENKNVLMGRSFPPIPGGLSLYEPWEISQDGNSLGVLHSQQELLLPQCFLEPTKWWDNRQHEKSSRFPDFEHRDTKLAPSPSTSNSILSNDPGPCSADMYKSSVTVQDFTKLCETGHLIEAVNALDILVQTEARVPTSLFYVVLKSCAARKDLVLSRLVHDLIVKVGYESNTFLANHLLRMYASHGRLQEAKDVFTRVAKPDAFSWSAIIAAHGKHGEPKQAIVLYKKMRTSSVKPDGHVFAAALQACASATDLESGRLVHNDVLERGIQPNLFVWNCLVDMYAKCGRLQEARTIFDSLLTKDVVTWTAMIAGYAKHELGLEALALYARMEQEGVVLADSVTFACLLKVCATVGDMEQGKKLHSQILERGWDTDIVVGNSLVDMYATGGRLQDARKVFDSLATKDVVTCNTMITGYVKGGRLKDAHMLFNSLTLRNVVSWNVMIAGYVEHEQVQEALDLLEKMELEGDVLPNPFTFASLLKACSRVGALQQGRQLHSQIVERGLGADTVLGTCLIDMYAKCGRLEDARKVFDGLPTKDVVTWTAIIAGYADHGQGQESLAVYKKMETGGMILANSFTYACLLKACATVGALNEGKQLHSQILKRGLETDIFVGNSLVDMYAKCGKLDDARRVFDTLVTTNMVTCNTMISGYTKSGRLKDARRLFDSLATRDVVTWNAMIAGYTEHELSQEALSLYEQMVLEGELLANPVTFACLLKACSQVGALHQGKQIHSQILERGLEGDSVVGTCLVDMYVKCGKLEDAQKVFESLSTRDVVTWTKMIAGYADHGFVDRALALYDIMEQEGLILANSFTYTCLLKACATVGALQQAKRLHSQILQRGLEADIFVGNSLVNMYAKCSRLEDARKVFDSLATRDIVTCNAMITGYAKCGMLEEAHRIFDSLAAKDLITWNAMIAGYVEHGLNQEALDLYARMEPEDAILADHVTYSCLLKACASAAALQQGKQLHSQIVQRGLEANTVVGTCLVDMYAKCGRLEDARRVFDSLPTKDVVTWTVMIDSFGQSNEGHKAIECFKEMILDGVQANETTFTCLLVACSHEGLVKEGRQFFKAMVEEQGITPTTEHYTCMVDLLGRAGYLDEAEKMLLSFKSNDVGLMSMLNASRSHGDIERGIRCFHSLLRSDPQNAAAYVLMGKIYADAGRWSDVERIEKLRKFAGASKTPALAGIELDRHVHTFVVGEDGGAISSKVRGMNTRLKEGGHVPHTELVLKQVSDKQKEDELCGHAEKLALAYGLLNTPDGTPLLVTKNMRMCGDCHSSTEVMSRIEKREIVVRDAHRVHRFVDGSCRCGGRP